MGDSGSNHGSLRELKHEVAVYRRLHQQQGVSVPRLFAHGWIKGTTCYFLALELLGPTLQDLSDADQDALQPSAIQALEQVHARGIWHRCGLFHGL